MLHGCGSCAGNILAGSSFQSHDTISRSRLSFHTLGVAECDLKWTSSVVVFWVCRGRDGLSQKHGIAEDRERSITRRTLLVVDAKIGALKCFFWCSKRNERSTFADRSVRFSGRNEITSLPGLMLLRTWRHACAGQPLSLRPERERRRLLPTDHSRSCAH